MSLGKDAYRQRDSQPRNYRHDREHKVLDRIGPHLMAMREDPGPLDEGRFCRTLDDAVRSALGDLCTTFQRIDWTREAIGSAIKATAAKHSLKPPQVMMAVRTLVTGTPQTPAIDAVLVLIGRDRTVERLGRGLAT